MVERLHRQLKAALITYEKREHWADHLPLVLLGLRSAFKTDLRCTSAELVHGCSLRLPGDFLTPPPADGPSDPAGYVADLRRLFEHIRPVIPRQRSDHSVFVSQDLSSCTHGFGRRDAARRPLTPAFDGRYHVIERPQKTCTLDINGLQDVVTAHQPKPPHPKGDFNAILITRSMISNSVLGCHRQRLGGRRRDQVTIAALSTCGNQTLPYPPAGCVGVPP
ncbi:uncharacterized protein LOC144166220 [Haemaphysalis longicornis]